MNVWLWAATVLLGGLLPCGWVALRASYLEGLAAVELAGVLVTLVLVCLAQGFRREIYFDVALVLAPLQLVGSLVFVRALERGL